MHASSFFGPFSSCLRDCSAEQRDLRLFLPLLVASASLQHGPLDRVAFVDPSFPLAEPHGLLVRIVLKKLCCCTSVKTGLTHVPMVLLCPSIPCTFCSSRFWRLYPCGASPSAFDIRSTNTNSTGRWREVIGDVCGELRDAVMCFFSLNSGCSPWCYLRARFSAGSCVLFARPVVSRAKRECTFVWASSQHDV